KMKCVKNLNMLIHFCPFHIFLFLSFLLACANMLFALIFHDIVLGCVNAKEISIPIHWATQLVYLRAVVMVVVIGKGTGVECDISVENKYDIKDHVVDIYVLYENYKCFILYLHYS
ncbi:hypothetical protein ACJX0J_013434, partial [Zea mays]